MAALSAGASDHRVKSLAGQTEAATRHHRVSKRATEWGLSNARDFEAN